MNAVEEEGIRMLRDELPDHYVVIGNFELQPANRRNTLEYDAVVVGEYGIWVVEIKGWGGKISGDIRRWSLDWGPVENPLIRTEMKAKALRHFLVTHCGGLPDDVFCESAVFLPLPVDITLDDPRRDKVIHGESIWRFFDDQKRIEELGPGPLLDGPLRDRLVACITPAVTEPQDRFEIRGYDIEAELSREDVPYREFVGRHKMLSSRNKVRIKRFEMDPLMPKKDRQASYNRIMRDMEALGRLEENPYVARAYDVIQDRTNKLVFYLVTEWVGPKTLSSYIEGNAEDEQVNGFEICSHLLRAISYLHSQGIMHRKLHPGVVFLVPDRSVPLKLADFDYARIATLPSIATDLNELATVGYTAPEIYVEQRDDYDHGVDIYAIGVMMVEVLLRQRLMTTLEDVLQHRAIWDSTRNQFDEELRSVLDRFLAPDPNERRPDMDHALRVFDERAKKI